MRGVPTLPPRVLVSRRAAERVLPGLAYALPESTEIRDADLSTASDRPAVLLLTPEDILGPQRRALMEVSRACLPGRPVLLGGTSNRDALMAAINLWQVGRVLPNSASADDIAAALLDAHKALSLERAVPLAAIDLLGENRRLEIAMGELKRAQERLLHAERLSTMGRITGGLIVALKQHLAELAPLEAVIASHQTTDPDVTSLVQAAFDGIRGISGLIDEVRAYAEKRGDSLSLGRVDLDRLVKRIVAFSRYDRLGRDRVVEASFGSQATVSADSQRLTQALLNLLRNAFQATEASQRVRVSTYCEGNDAVIAVRDEGRGMPPAVLERVFQPFFTTKEEGMGLGLHVTRMSIERQQGTMECESEVDVGTTFRIRLPRLP